MAGDDGPVVTLPARNGFGLRLLPRAFEICGGSVETDFETSGLICRMKLTLPAADSGNRNHRLARSARGLSLKKLSSAPFIEFLITDIHLNGSRSG